MWFDIHKTKSKANSPQRIALTRPALATLGHPRTSHESAEFYFVNCACGAINNTKLFSVVKCFFIGFSVVL